MVRLSDTDWIVMRVVWARGPVTARQVLDAVGDDAQWAYTTVKTMLTRLVEKGAIEVDDAAKAGSAAAYRALISQSLARRSALRGLVDRAFGGTFGSLVQHMADEEPLSSTERKRLVRWLDAEQRGEREAPSRSKADTKAMRARRRLS